MRIPVRGRIVVIGFEIPAPEIIGESVAIVVESIPTDLPAVLPDVLGEIGVGHPGDKELMTSYLTSVTMPAVERELAEAAWRLDDDVVDSLVHGQIRAAMNGLHKPQE